ncbi:hypothetical protein B0H19DRAFT_1199680 [Mycena capillaripes]|nr:hypothetical protein B0H19DRAFT_1199680 [Mycena capillaripes]
MFLATIVLAVSTAHLVAAQFTDDNSNPSIRNSAIGLAICTLAFPKYCHSQAEPIFSSFTVAALIVIFSCCGARPCRARRAATTGPALLLASPHGTEPAAYRYSSGTTPAGSEYPPTAAADYAPPPYVKERGGAEHAPVCHLLLPPFPFICQRLICGGDLQPPGPPPGNDEEYSLPPGPPPRAHISANSADFSDSFRLPPAL